MNYVAIDFVPVEETERKLPESPWDNPTFVRLPSSRAAKNPLVGAGNPSISRSSADHGLLTPDTCWQAPAGSPLALTYLAWGGRNGLPLFPSTRRWEEWVYIVVETGKPTLLIEDKVKLITGPALLVIRPGLRFSWQPSDQPYKMLEWRWRRPIHPAVLDRQNMLYCVLTPSDHAELRQLHALMRAEVHRGYSRSETALMGLQALLETLIVRISEGGACDPRKEVVRQALRWIEANLSTRQPLARLADFLGVSPATVRRLFREQMGSTVMKIVAEFRRREAERMLANREVTVKEVAYHLGYRHPHDFSRAFRKHTGKLPSRILVHAH